ncbi:extracellular protease [Xanthomonas oryzae pv. oryzae PXO99A]|uniref:Extracellular protease n=1 Tax=Xanthomonas oryzae pv. oryzae (strain PXO99A) TaxID=360094 RepID=A0A0K0GR71_XANOP|nr:extracellular protease [Xanthomonas oryzae pv. oryzae PXO99A]
MAAWHWAGLAISAEVLQLKVRANQEKKSPGSLPGFYMHHSPKT